MKRIIIALAIIAGSLAPANAAGTIPLSLSQQFDEYGKPLSGCRLYTIQAGTTAAPQNAYQDAGLTIALPNPITCTASGRLPQFFLADGLIKVRLTDKNGTTVLVADGVQVIGPSGGGGGGGGGSVDPTTVAQTGDIKSRYGVGTLEGWVRLNGRTIGSATSGATERANNDTRTLFTFLWNSSANLTVTPSRGASADADWLANKTVTLPDGRGRVLAGLDDMGNSDALRLQFSFAAANKTLGAATSLDYEYLTVGMLPPHNHAVYLYDPGHSHLYGPPNLPDFGGTSSVQAWQGNGNNNRYSTSTSFTGMKIFSGAGGTGVENATENAGSGLPHRTLQPTLLITNYIKL